MGWTSEARTSRKPFLTFQAEESAGVEMGGCETGGLLGLVLGATQGEGGI